jgi:hypothetical protein
VTGLSIEDITKEMIPWYLVLLFALLIMILFPQVILCLPGLLSALAFSGGTKKHMQTRLEADMSEKRIEIRKLEEFCAGR